MTAVMEGVRILEVAEHTFVPAASALLADWGAEVIKIEHVERGDAMRGLAVDAASASMGTDVHVLLEHSNRGKKSLGLDLTTEDGLELLYKLAATCDVFLTNKMPSVRKKLKVDVEDIQRRQPEHHLRAAAAARATLGPDADRGSYDVLAYWHRAGIAMGMQAADDEYVPPPPAPAFGDSIGAMTIAGGIMGALFHREQTGEATTVDVSLLGIGMWSMGAAIALSLQLEHRRGGAGRRRARTWATRWSRTYQTKDDRYVSLCCLQAGKLLGRVVGVVGRPELADDERFADAASHQGERRGGVEILAATPSPSAPLAEWREACSSRSRASGPWCRTPSRPRRTRRPWPTATSSSAPPPDGTPFKLAAAPIQFGGEAARRRSRAPEFNEHGDEILASLGLDMDAIIDLKVRGVVA